MPFQRCIIRPGALGGFRIRTIMSRNKIISITCPPRQLQTWEYYRQNRTIKPHFMRCLTSSGVLSKNMGFYPSSDRIVEINTQTLKFGTWRQIIQQTNIPPTPCAQTFPLSPVEQKELDEFLKENLSNGWADTTL